MQIGNYVFNKTYKCFFELASNSPVNKVNNRNTRARRKICSKLTN